MPVKDLVGLYESCTSSVAPSGTTRSARANRSQVAVERRVSITGVPQGAGSSSGVLAPSQDGSTSSNLAGTPLPPSSPARFIGHPLLKRDSSPFDSIPSLARTSFTPTHDHVTNTYESQAEDRSLLNDDDNNFLQHSNPHLNDPTDCTHISTPDSKSDLNTQSFPAPCHSELEGNPSSQSTLSSSSGLEYATKSPRTGKHDIPFTSLRNGSQDTLFTSDNKAFSSDCSTTLYGMSSSTLTSGPTHAQIPSGQKQRIGSHTPVPATTVFAKDSPPLYLPKLDNYLSLLPIPSFTSSATGSKHKESKVDMFPPMDRLAASGKSLQDLETNSKIIPSWRNRNSILGSLVNLALGATGSSVLASFYSLQGIFDTVQVFALILSTIVPHSGGYLSSKWKALFLGTIPNVLALNFASTLVQSLIFLLIFMAISVLLLYCFFVATNRCSPADMQEGLQSMEQSKGGWGLITVSFILTILYLPLSTIAVHALVWSDDFWIVPNPYINATSYPPVLPPLGPSDQFRDPLDFCYTTTMKRNEVNFAPAIVIVSAATFLFMTVWFPFRLRHFVLHVLPIVDKFNELGEARSKSDLDREYQRLLSRDRNPISFLYDDFRRGWGTYKAFYLFAKLTALLIIATINPDNCLFRTLSRTLVCIVRQAVLVLAMLLFFLLQCFLAPFVDPVNNASEFTSRMNYVLTALIGLGVALNIPGQDALNGPVLYAVYIITYGLGAYFTVVNFSWMHRVIKRLSRRIDFSIDVFSPRLDISPTSPHVRRRIWQEAISSLFLTSPECKIPGTQPMTFAQAPDSEYPPYLLSFAQSPAERHIENLKILREVGSVAYAKGVTTIYGGDLSRYRHLQDRIQSHYVGPDSYWKDPERTSIAGCTDYFGNAWWIPFPPTLVLRYDDGPLVVLNEIRELEEYVIQNHSHAIKRKREIRMALRALDGRIVNWPYAHEQLVGERANLWCCGGRQYKARSVVKYQSCVLHIKRRGSLLWEGLQLGGGFGIELTYAKKVRLDGSAIGLNDDYNLNPSLAHFLAINRSLIATHLFDIERIIQSYRDYHRKECLRKAAVLSYRFLTCVYDQPQESGMLSERTIDIERDLRVQQLVVGNEIAFDVSYERHSAVTSSEVGTWWYIFWDDLWRRNFDTITALKTHAQDFDPHYPTSIAYRPLPRPALEAFLIQRGLLSKTVKRTDFFHSGFLNKVYLRINDIVFRGSNNAILFHLGRNPSEVDLEDIDLATQARPSTLGTGGGTDHDDESIRARPNYRWEGILEDPLSKGKRHRQGWSAKLGVWFGVTPLWRTGIPSEGLALDVRLENGRYVLMGEDSEFERAESGD